MKYKITIPEPCSENWDSMTSADKGRRCAVCDKTVHDFSSFTKSELRVFLEENKGVCGKIPTKLLDLPMTKERSSYAATIALAAVLSVSPVMAQNWEADIEKGDIKEPVLIRGDSAKDRFYKNQQQFVIKGKVIGSNDKIGLPGVAVFLSSHPERNSTVYGGFDGVFEFEVPKDIGLEDVILRFSFIGHEDVDVKIEKTNLNLEIILPESTEIIGEVMYSVGKAKVKKEKRIRDKK